MNKLLRLLIGLTVLFSSQYVCAQAIIQKEKLKYFPQKNERYPYAGIEYDNELAYVMHKPVLHLSPSSFLTIWPPENKSSRHRLIRKYNLLLEIGWECLFKMEYEEEILSMNKADTFAVVLSTFYDRSVKQQLVKARYVGLESGLIQKEEILFVAPEARSDNVIHFSMSADSSRYLLYYYDMAAKKKRAYINYDFLLTNEYLGHRVLKTDIVPFAVFDHNFERVYGDTLELNLERSKRAYGLGLQIDMMGNVYTTIFEKPTHLSIVQFSASSREQKELTYYDFPDYWKENDIYLTHMPGIIGENGHVYLAISDREKARGNWHTFGFKVLDFDFIKEEVNTKRNVRTNSTVHIQVSKAREKYGLKPAKRFDKYMILDIRMMQDQSMWLITQKVEEERLVSSFSGTSGFLPKMGMHLQEIVMFEFNPEGEFTRSIVIPSQQYSFASETQPSLFFQLTYDQENNVFKILTEEKSGDKLNLAERLFYREVDLNTSEVSERKLIYKGRRNFQLWYKFYSVWLNHSILATMVEEGYREKVYMMTIDLNAEPEEKKKKKRNEQASRR
ncbi:MAG: hypothetical protein AAF824_17535 [Bacteroidota bacterium]